jgi:hypothetical protein
VFTSKNDQDALDVLAEWEARASSQRAGTQKEGTARPEPAVPQKKTGWALPPQPKKVEVPAVRRPMKKPCPVVPPQREGMRTIQAMMPKEEEDLKPPPSPAKVEMSRDETAEEGILFFDDPAMLWQGIIISEILRPPLARRNPFLVPYQRG